MTMPPIPRKPFLAKRLILCLCVLAALTGGAIANPVYQVVPEAYYPDTELGDISETRTHGAFGERIPAHVKKIITLLQKKRGAQTSVLQSMWLKGADNQEYLIVNWNRFSLGLEIHRIDRLPNNKFIAKFLRQIEGESISIREPSGRTVFPGEPPVVVIDIGLGGSNIENYFISLIQMTRNSVDIVPSYLGRPVDLSDIDGDGTYELVVIDNRWSGFFSGCGACGPHIPTFFSRKNGKFAPACNAHRAIYRAEIDKYRRFLDKARSLYEKAEILANMALRYAQLGEFDRADRSYAMMMAALQRGSTASSEFERQLVKKSKNHIGTASRQARGFADTPCPLSATDTSGAHPGLDARINSFRMK